MRGMFLALFFLLFVFCGCHDIAVLVHHYDPNKVYQGRTMTLLPGAGCFLAFDFTGDVHWHYVDDRAGGIHDFEVLEDTNILYIRIGGRPTILEYPDQTVYVGTAQGAHHSISELPWGNLLYVTAEGVETGGWMGTIQSDNIEEFNPDTGEVVWQWKSHEHIDPDTCYCPVCIHTEWEYGADWTHGNTVHFYEDESAILYNPRNLDTLYMISYPDGEILWACGRCGGFGQGLFSHVHDPYFLPNGNILMFDNGNHRQPQPWSRALEISIDPEEQEASVVWEYRETPDFFDPSMCDANRLPNGNTLITDAWQGRILEVNSAAEKVWEATIVNQFAFDTPYMMYKAERIPSHLWDCWDNDSDGFRDEASGGNDCDDADPYVNPGESEGPPGDPTCADGSDNDCDGYADESEADCTPLSLYAPQGKGTA